jgi:aryl-alcohol dehydrogenase-like predicted oxidoreductase
MRYAPLGTSGLLVSDVGLGCNNFGWRIDVDATRSVVDAAIDAGITLFDTADIYGNRGGSESALGEVLAGRRDDIVLATKFGGDMAYGPAAGARGGRLYVRRAVEASLRRLKTDRIDLLQLHMPDPVTPVEETIAALQELVGDGLIRYWGHSNLTGWQLAQFSHVARELGGPGPVSAQNHWSLLARDVEREVVPAAAAYGVGVLPFFPLASGLLTGKVSRSQAAPADSRLADDRFGAWITDKTLDRVEALSAWASEHGRTMLEVAFGWLSAQPTVGSVIAGATKPEQIVQNVAAVERPLTADEVEQISGLVPLAVLQDF